MYRNARGAGHAAPPMVVVAMVAILQRMPD